MYCKHLSMPRKTGCHDDEILSWCHITSESFDEWPSKIYCLYQLWSVWIFCPKLRHLLPCQVNSMLLYHFLSFCGQQVKKQKKNKEEKETLGYKPLLLYLLRQLTYLQAMYYDMTETKGKRTRSVLSLSSIGLHFHSIDLMTEKCSFSSP